MSRIGKKPIAIPDKVEIKIDQDDIIVKGPLGELTFGILPGIEVKVADKQITITRQSDEPTYRSAHGLTARQVENMIEGVLNGFKKELEVVGVGYKVNMKGKDLELSLGYSHPILFTPPEGIKIEVEKMNITVSGIDRQQVGQVAANIREFRKPEPYKGKGVKYVDEYIKRKAGKMAAAAGGGAGA